MEQLEPRRTAVQFEQLMKLAEFRRELRDARVDRMWRIGFGVWALLAAVIIKSELSWALAWGAAFLAFALHVWWVVDSWRSARRDQNRMFQFQDRALLLLNEKPPRPTSDSPAMHPEFWLQVAATAILASAALLAHPAPGQIKALF